MSAEIPVFVKSGRKIKVEQDTTFIKKTEELLFLMDDQEKMDRVRCDFAGIQRFLAHATGAKIPQDFAQSLGFLDQKWQMVYSPYKPNTIPYLFLGSDEQFDRIIPYNDAISTIHLDRNLNDRNVVSGFKRIRLAGVDYETGRVVAANYDTGRDKNLFGIDVSIPEIDILLPSYKRSGDTLNSIGSMPTPVSHPLWNSGLITKAMVDMVCDGDFAALKTLRAVATRKDGSRLDFFGDFYDELEDLGYYTQVEADTYRLCYYPQRVVFEDVVPWEVSVPKSLDKTLRARIFSFGKR